MKKCRSISGTFQSQHLLKAFAEPPFLDTDDQCTPFIIRDSHL
ncbi:MAG: hypothetical protein RL021_1645 [Bacteroidota bacterium]